jgi:hypothetical protein
MPSGGTDVRGEGPRRIVDILMVCIILYMGVSHVNVMPFQAIS